MIVICMEMEKRRDGEENWWGEWKRCITECYDVMLCINNCHAGRLCINNCNR